MPLIFQQLPLKRIGASAFPTFYACALIVLAVLLVIRDLLQAKPASCANAQENRHSGKQQQELRQPRFILWR